MVADTTMIIDQKKYPIETMKKFGDHFYRSDYEIG